MNKDRSQSSPQPPATGANGKRECAYAMVQIILWKVLHRWQACVHNVQHTEACVLGVHGVRVPSRWPLRNERSEVVGRRGREPVLGGGSPALRQRAPTFPGLPVPLRGSGSHPTLGGRTG